MKKITILMLLFLPLNVFSQEECMTKIEVLQNPPSLFDIVGWDHEDRMDISRRPEIKAEEITDTFEVYRRCTDNGVSVLYAIRPHGGKSELGFREGYQIVFWNDRAPDELKEVAVGDCALFKIKPFFKANCMPGGVIQRPIELDGVWISVFMSESSNIYSIEPSSIHKLKRSDCNCDGEQ